MRSHPLHFMLGFAVGYLPLLWLLVNTSALPAEPLAEEQENTHIAVVLETVEPEALDSSQVLAAAADSLKPSAEPTEAPEATSTPKPTPEPTVAPTPTETPAPTETPVPTATPDVWPPPEYEPWFSQYAGAYGIDKNVLDRIANCESHFNASAVSPNGAYVGMFQFSASGWEKNRGAMGADPNLELRTNAEESIKTAAYVISTQGTGPWPSCLR